MVRLMKIGNSRIMIGGSSERNLPTRSMYYLYVEDVDSLYKQAVDAGSKSVVEPSNQFYGDRHSAIEDPEGNQWWIASHVEDVPEEEMKKREEEFRKKQAAA